MSEKDVSPLQPHYEVRDFLLERSTVADTLTCRLRLDL